MASFKAKDGSGWKDASAIYGKNASGWQYAKEAFAKTADGWQRVWTDCRLYDAGGRDWSPPSEVITYSGTCGNRTQTTTVTRTKTGCPPDVRSTTVSSPNCDANCFDASAVNCDGCGSATYYTAKAGSNCTSYQVGSCGSWSNLAPAFQTVAVSNGTYDYVSDSLYGWVYSNSAGESVAACGGGTGLLGPENVQVCSAGGYRVTGTDVCRTV